jgi:hypothetical protein
MKNCLRRKMAIQEKNKVMLAQQNNEKPHNLNGSLATKDISPVMLKRLLQHYSCCGYYILMTPSHGKNMLDS